MFKTFNINSNIGFVIKLFPIYLVVKWGFWILAVKNEKNTKKNNAQCALQYHILKVQKIQLEGISFK